MSSNKVYWYVLFVRTGSEEEIVGRLKTYLDNKSFQPFILQKGCVFRRKGKKTLFYKNCFPGYVFIESNKSTVDFWNYVFPVIYEMEDVYKVLHYGDRSNMSMREEERVGLYNIFGLEHCIGISTGFKDGDSVKVISGALKGYESKILQINKNRKTAVIAINMFENVVNVSVGMDIIEKI